MTVDPAPAPAGPSASFPDQAFAHAMAVSGPFEAAPTLAVAVSGGSDSLALCKLAADWSAARGGRVLALTVDHGLRPEAAEEARWVGAQLAALGLEHRVVVLPAPPPDRAIQETLRRRRLDALTAVCRTAGILHLLLGHQADDLAETYWMRRRRGGGPRPVGPSLLTLRDGMRLLRPLVGVSRQRLQDWLRVRGQTWVDDPSNADTAFERVRARAALLQASDGTRAEARSAAHARHVLEGEVLAWIVKHVRPGRDGAADIDLPVPPDAIAVEGVRRALAWVRGARRPPGPDAVARCLVAPGVRHTVGGCLIVPTRAGVRLCREAGRVTERLAATPGRAQTWDDRWQVTAQVPGTIGKLGPEGARAWRAADAAVARRHVLELSAFPGVWQDDGLVARPGQGLALVHAPPIPLCPPRYRGPVAALSAAS